MLANKYDRAGLVWLLASGLLAGLAGCTQGGVGGPQAIASCSLGCSSSGAASQFSCGVTDVFVNQEVRVTFATPIDIKTVNNNTFKVVEMGVGKTPPGTFGIDPTNDRILIYRPLLTFDSSGNPSFGLQENSTYSIAIPGTNSDPVGPYIRNVFGEANKTRLFCVVVASRGVFDVQSGAPSVALTVDILGSGGVLTAQNPETSDFDANDPVVCRSTDITMVFDDIMNPATLVNPVTGQSSTIKVRVDADGNLGGSADQVDLPGAFSIALDQNRLRTTVVFRPQGDLPSSGSDPMHARKVVVILPNTIEDLGGNPLDIPRQISFTPERIVFDALTVDEGFDGTNRRDGPRSGQGWSGNGNLVAGLGGGSGRLGELLIPAGRTVVLKTDPMVGEDFSSINDPTIFNPLNVLQPTTFGTVDPVLDGIFEFSRLRIDSGGTLRVVGPAAPRIYVRGECVIQGRVDLAGRSALSHDSAEDCGGVGGEAGPGGGTGGDGGDRPDGDEFDSVGGIQNPKMPVLYDDVDGKDGGGIAAPSTIAMSPTLVAGGGGGLAWPQPNVSMAFPTLHFPDDIFDVTGMQFEEFLNCQNIVPGGAGGGGGYAFPGEDADNRIPSITIGGMSPNPEQAPEALGGDNSALMLDAGVRKLDPEMGYLRGGGGGGGGGGHLQETRVNGQVLVDCTVPTSGSLVIDVFQSHSSAGGGGAGGAAQFQAGSRLQLDGTIDASGGNGGRTVTGGLAQAGGAGAGGGVLLQAPLVTLQPVPNRIDVTGGDGGTGANNSRGGDASPGIVRLEAISPALDPVAEATKVVPTLSQLQADYPGAAISDIFSVGTWNPDPDVVLGRDGFSGVQSCWIRPEGNFFELQFYEDGNSPASLGVGGLGWDMTITINGVPMSFRTPDGGSGMSLEDMFGNQLGTAPVLVLFQGARARGVLPDPCGVQLTGVNRQIFAGSLTGWVTHPAMLNDFFGANNPVLRPNIFRFVVLWDASDPMFFDMIEGISEIRVPLLPD